MPVDGANLQGANVRQVIVQADVAALSLRPPPPTDSAARPLAQLGERLLGERNQSVGEDLYVQSQEDDVRYSAGDALNGNGKQDGERQRRRRQGSENAEDASEASEASANDEEPWSQLGDIGQAQERLKACLDGLHLSRASEVFREMDRSLLTGLLMSDVPIRSAQPGMASYQRQTIQVQTAPEAFRLAVHGAMRAAEVCAESNDPDAREKARKLISLARQTVRSDSAAGHELSAFLDDSLLEVSRMEGRGELRAVALLAIVDSAISLWRERHNVGTVVPWSLL